MQELIAKVGELRDDLNELIDDRNAAKERIKALAPLAEHAKAVYEELRSQLEDAQGDLRGANDALENMREQVAGVETVFAAEVARQQTDFSEEVAGLREDLDQAQEPADAEDTPKK